MSIPKLGMAFEDVRKRVKRIAQTDNAIPEKRDKLINSLLNQTRLCDGEKAHTEIKAELSALNKRVHALSGAGNKQVGWGEGKRLGPGKWIFENGRWRNVDR